MVGIAKITAGDVFLTILPSEYEPEIVHGDMKAVRINHPYAAVFEVNNAERTMSS